MIRDTANVFMYSTCAQVNSVTNRRSAELTLHRCSAKVSKVQGLCDVS